MFTATAYICGSFGLVLSLTMLIPMTADLFVGNLDWQSFLFSAFIVGVPALLLVNATRGPMPDFSLKFGFLLVNAVWITASVVTAVPIFMSKQQIGLTNAVFEAVSGITTTGATVLTGLDYLPPGLLLWRSLIQWFGGLGIIAMGLLLLPFLRVGGMQIYKMESSLQDDSPFSRFGKFSSALVSLYVGLTFACIFAYALTGMSIFDAVNHAMTTVSTGGFSTHDLSMGAFGLPTLAVSTVFMLAGALPFIALIKVAVSGNLRDGLDPQIPVLIGILVVLSLIAGFAALPNTDEPVHEIMIGAFFNVTSLVSTTGFASTDYTLWGALPVGVFLLATFLGGTAGSTSGGLKTYRLIIIYQSLKVTISELVFPHGIFPVRYGGVKVEPGAVQSVMFFITMFFVVLLLTTLGLSATGLDVLTAFTGALTALTNVGPGLGEIIGPAGNFAALSDVAKWMLVVAMLLGRLEILTMLVLLSPSFWRH